MSKKPSTSSRPAAAGPRARRQPKQARSARRREELLAVAGRLLDEIGAEATTTTAIAEAAGASIGTVYEYFPHREALLRALLDGYRARLRAAVEAALAGADPGSWRDAAGRCVDAFVRFYRREPGYRVLWLESQTTPALREAGEAWGAEFSAVIGARLREAAPALRPARARAIARVAVHLISSLTSLALAGPASQRASTLREARAALEAYLERALNESTAAATRPRRAR
ncbi:MAG: TetR family transcriptional regulator [Nannocystaceae bacterium]